MEARVGGGSHQFYIAGPSNGLGKLKSAEWDLNEWKWDGDLFMATPLNGAPSECRSMQLFPAPATQGLSNSSLSGSDQTDFGISGKGNGESEKRRRIVVAEVDGTYHEEGSLTLNLGGSTHPIVEEELANWEGNDRKRSKLQGGNSSYPTCQVEGCGADLSGAKDYHRRHKVCEMHAKASKAVVGNVTQRFCQQCSRFHLLQEFDEGKRSCRRRLAGHNRRRRKTDPDATISGSSMTDDQSSYLLINLLRLLSNLHSDKSDPSKDQDFLGHILRNIASLGGSSDARNLSALLQASQDMQKVGASAGTSSEAVNPLRLNGVAAQVSSKPLCSPSKMTCMTGTQGPLRPMDNYVSVSVDRVELSSERNVMKASLGETVQAVPSKRSAALLPVEDILSDKAEALRSFQCMLPAESTVERVRLKDFDLNNAYDDAQDCIEGYGKSTIPGTLGSGSPDVPLWMLQDSHHLSPPQTSGNSDSTSARSLSNSNGDAQSRTGRIVFKLFGKNPNDFPLSLRRQILDWLSQSPTDMESYIRPGCIILTVYIHLDESRWEELSHDLSSSLNKLLNLPGVDFWRTGWLYARIQHRIAFIYNGQLVLDAPLPLKSHDRCSILSITPIAVSISARVNFEVKGLNLARSTVRLLCAFDGRYLVPDTPQPLFEGTNMGEEHDGSQCFKFSCSLPNATGRGFIEVEDDGLSSGGFPFIIAEQDVCTDIRMLESTIEAASCDDIFGGKSDAIYARNQAIEFLHEMGWLLRRSQLKSRSDQMNSASYLLPLTRYRWLMEFAMAREWCAVVKKLLDILFQGNIELGEQSPIELVLSEDLLHSAVRKNCRSMVELLLIYTPDTTSKETGHRSFLFRPDMLGPSNITPLHIAASSCGAEGVLDALTDDPRQLGIKAWNTICDSTGFTPKDYARSRGFQSYIDLVQKKSEKGDVVLDIPGNLLASAAAAAAAAHNQPDGPNPGQLTVFQIDKSQLRSVQQMSCKLCDRQLVRRSYVSRSLLYRPMTLSLVGIAAVCVCVGLLLKGPPEVRFVKSPFRWESLDFGWI